MVLKRESVSGRLEELDRILSELLLYESVTVDDLQLKGLGGFRNILVHLYQDIDLDQLWQNYRKALGVFPHFGREVAAWLDRVDS